MLSQLKPFKEQEEKVFKYFPKEVLKHCFRYSDAKTLKRLERVNKQFKSYVEELISENKNQFYTVGIPMAIYTNQQSLIKSMVFKIVPEGQIEMSENISNVETLNSFMKIQEKNIKLFFNKEEAIEYGTTKSNSTPGVSMHAPAIFTVKCFPNVFESDKQKDQILLVSADFYVQVGMTSEQTVHVKEINYAPGFAYDEEDNSLQPPKKSNSWNTKKVLTAAATGGIALLGMFAFKMLNESVTDLNLNNVLKL